jgi:uncharacterized RDD family membrane protein YckC
MSATPESADLRSPASSSARPGRIPTATAPCPVRYVGLITRAVAFAVDAAVINLVAIVVEVGAALILSLVHVASGLKPPLVTVAAVAYALWAMGYFVGFWAGTGQTPGSRVMQIRVVSLQGEPIKPVRGVVRCIGLLLAALPLFAGYLMILFNRRRRGLQDYMARTVVVEAPQLSVADVRRVKFRAAHPPKAVTGDGRQIPPPNPGRSYDSGDDRDSAHVQA